MTETEKYIIDRIYELIAYSLDVELKWVCLAGFAASLRDETRGYGLKELEIIELIADIEEIFCIELDNDKAQTVQTVGDLIELVKSTRKENYKE